MNNKEAESSQSKPLQLGLLGYQIQKSASPQIYKYLGKLYKVDLSYKIYNVRVKDLDDFLDLEFPKLDGINITTPYKRKATRKLLKKGFINDSPLENCNTTFHSLLNTDLYAIQKLIHVLPCKTLIYGSGDVVETLLYHLKQLKFQDISIMTRSKPKQEYPDVEYLEWNNFEEPFQFFINATPLGTASSPLPIPEQRVAEHTFDLNYSQAHNQLKNMSLSHTDGKSMLIWQAIKNFEIWTNIPVEESVFEELYEIL